MNPPPEKAVAASNWEAENIFETLESEGSEKVEYAKNELTTIARRFLR